MGLSCNSSVCLNGGTCTYNNTTIQCICPSDFAGARCEWSKKNILFLYWMNIRKIFIGSVCSINTCLNGGTCRQIASTMAECLCATGFTGPTCSLRMLCCL